VLGEAFRKKDMVSFGFSKKKLFGTLPPLLNKPVGFITKLLEKQFKDSPWESTSNPGCRDYALRFIGTCTFFIEFGINSKRARCQIVFSITKQHNNKERLVTDFFERLHFEQSFFKTVFKELLAKPNSRSTATS